MKSPAPPNPVDRAVDPMRRSRVDHALEQWDGDGFVVLPSFLSPDEIAPAVAELPDVFPTADEFHDDLDPPAPSWPSRSARSTWAPG